MLVASLVWGLTAYTLAHIGKGAFGLVDAEPMSFPLMQAGRPHRDVRDTMRSLQRKVQMKYAFRTSSHLNRRSTQTAEAELDGDNLGWNFAVHISIGTPPQQFSLQADTGSSLTWIPSSQCLSQNPCVLNKVHKFHTESSSSFVDLGREMHIRYGIGELSGSVGRDILHFANATIPLTFGMAVKMDKSFRDPFTDGLLGLGYPSLAIDATETPVETFWEAANKAGIPSIFGMYLQAATTTNESGGMITIGGFDEQYYDKEKIMWNTVVRQAYWEIKAPRVLLGRQVIQESSDLTAIVDSGTSLLVVPDQILSAVAAETKARLDSGLHMVDCALMQTAPPLIFHLGNGIITLEAKDYIQQDYADTNVCVLTMMSSGKLFTTPTIIMGDTVMKTQYTIFDMENHRVGFAPVTHEPIATATFAEMARRRAEQKGVADAVNKAPPAAMPHGAPVSATDPTGTPASTSASTSSSTSSPTSAPNSA